MFRVLVQKAEMIPDLTDCHCQPNQEGLLAQMDETPPEISVRNAGPPRVLVVDDDLVTQAVLKHLLSYLGCLADTANCAKEALRRLSEQPYDLIFLDARLPDEHGSTIAKEIRSGGHSKDATIVAISSDDDADNVRRMRDAGADEFLTKPLFNQRIRETVERWLR